MKSRNMASMLVAVVGAWLAAPAGVMAQPTVDRVGPPSWWPAPAGQSVTILVEGSGLAGASARFATGPARVERSEPSPSGRALFVEVTIPPNAPAGPCELVVSAAGGSVGRRWDLVEPPGRAANPVGPDDVIYLIMPDRFVNGDPSNDEAGLEGDSMLDRRDPHAYHGGDFAGLRKRLPYLADLGVTAIWLTPIYRQAPRWFGEKGPGKTRYADFHGYSPVDFYDTNPRFGSVDEYRRLVDEAHRLGLKVIQDHVLGFTGPRHPWVQSPPVSGWFNGPVDHPPKCTFRFDAATNPHATEADRRGLTDGWFLGILPDLDLRNPRAAAYAAQQSAWWATLSAADGVRLDTYPMVDRSFWPAWSRRIAGARPGLRAIGEAWASSAADVSFFQGGRTAWDGVDPGVASVFDFALHAASVRVFSGQGPASDLAKALAMDHLYPRADLLTTMLGNHDTARIAAIPGVTPARARLAAAFLLTNRGTPQLTWGDEIGILGNENDRRDFPGGFPGDPVDAFSPEGRTPDQRATFDAYRDLLHLRARTSALRRGNLTILHADDTTYVAAREYQGERAVVAIHLGHEPATVKVPAEGLDRATDRAYGPGRWRLGDRRHTLELPPESATIFRTPNPGDPR